MEPDGPRCPELPYQAPPGGHPPSTPPPVWHKPTVLFPVISLLLTDQIKLRSKKTNKKKNHLLKNVSPPSTQLYPTHRLIVLDRALPLQRWRQTGGGASDRQPLTNPSSTPRVSAGVRGSRLALRAGRQPVTLPCDRSRARGNPPWGPPGMGAAKNARPRRDPPPNARQTDGFPSWQPEARQPSICPPPLPTPPHTLCARVWWGGQGGGGTFINM